MCDFVAVRYLPRGLTVNHGTPVVAVTGRGYPLRSAFTITVTPHSFKENESLFAGGTGRSSLWNVGERIGERFWVRLPTDSNDVKL